MIEVNKPMDTKRESIQKDFGKLVRYYRQCKLFYMQSQLAQASGLSKRTISDVENGQRVDLDRDLVTKLADVFKLTDVSERGAFFAAGGLTLQLPPSQIINAPLNYAEFYCATKFPAFISDGLCNLHSLNSALLAILEVNLEEHRIHKGAGPNILRFFFDPEFGAKKLYKENWRSHAEANAYFFFYRSRNSVGEANFGKLFCEFQNLPDFRDVWETVTSSYQPPAPPYTYTMYNTHYGVLRFQVAEMLLLHSAGSEQQHGVFYQPTDARTWDALEKINAVGYAAYKFTDKYKDPGFVQIRCEHSA